MTAPANALAASYLSGHFADSVGVNMHSGMSSNPIPYAYRDPALVLSCLNYLGVRHVRDGIGAGFGKPGYDYTAATEAALAAAGIKFDFPISTLADYEKAALIAFATRFPGALESLEGPNECNAWGVEKAKSFQKQLYDFVHGEAALAGVDVLPFTLTYGSTSYFAPYGDLSGLCDAGNVHIYAQCTPPTKFKTWLDVAQAAMPGRQMVVTETGYTTYVADHAWGVDEAAQAKYLLNTLMAAAAAGVRRTYLYELLDRNQAAKSPIQGFFGLFHADGAPKPAATAIRNLIAILSRDADAAAALGALSVVYNKAILSGTHTLLMQKSARVFDLVLWVDAIVWRPSSQSQLPASRRAHNLGFPGAASVTLFDPLVGVEGVALNPAAATFDVYDHPIVVEIALA